MSAPSQYYAYPRLIIVYRWIFIVEGCITAGFGLIAFVFMTANPATAKFLSPAEREIVLRANEEDRALHAHETFSKKQIKSAFTDWRMYGWAVMFLTTYIPVYSVVLGLPTVVSGLGYSGVTATLMAVPPYGVGFIAVLVSGWTVDRYGNRFLHYVIGISIATVALIILMAVKNLVVRYVMFFFVMFMYVFPSWRSMPSLTSCAQGSYRFPSCGRGSRPTWPGRINVLPPQDSSSPSETVVGWSLARYTALSGRRGTFKVTPSMSGVTSSPSLRAS